MSLPAAFADMPSPAPVPATGFAPELALVGVQDIQLQLLEHGYDPGPANGVLTDKTLAAILAFERDYDLPQDGVAGPVVQNMLHYMPRRAPPALIAALTPVAPASAPPASSIAAPAAVPTPPGGAAPAAAQFPAITPVQAPIAAPTTALVPAPAAPSQPPAGPPVQAAASRLPVAPPPQPAAATPAPASPAAQMQLAIAPPPPAPTAAAAKAPPVQPPASAKGPGSPENAAAAKPSPTVALLAPMLAPGGADKGIGVPPGTLGPDDPQPIAAPRTPVAEAPAPKIAANKPAPAAKPSPPTDAPLWTGDESVRQAQVYLKKLGFYKGEADGVMNWSTVEALTQFAASGMAPTSVIADPAHPDTVWLARLKTAAAAKHE